jgi:hypothetical protein
MHRDQRRGSAGLPPAVEFGFDPIVVWQENLAYACDLLAFTQAHISWYRRELADFQDRRLRARRAVAVDDKARIVLLYQGGVERVRDHAAEPGDADVPGDVAFALGFRNAEPAECARHGIARVIGDDQERRPAVRVVHSPSFLGETNNSLSIYIAAKTDRTKTWIAEDMDHAAWPVGPVGHPTELQTAFPLLTMAYTKYPQACKALMAFLMEADQFNKWLYASQGFSAHALNGYGANPVWTEDPKRNAVRDTANRTLTIGGLGSVGEKAANAFSDFVLVDMFANFCLGREDAKGAIKIAERQLQRIYR